MDLVADSLNEGQEKTKQREKRREEEDLHALWFQKEQRAGHQVPAKLDICVCPAEMGGLRQLYADKERTESTKSEREVGGRGHLLASSESRPERLPAIPSARSHLTNCVDVVQQIKAALAIVRLAIWLMEFIILITMAFIISMVEWKMASKPVSTVAWSM